MTLPARIPVCENNRYNMELLDQALDHIIANPETWRQDTWRCETGMCVAGWVAELAGETWYVDPSKPTDPLPYIVSEQGARNAFKLYTGAWVEDAPDVANRLLGLETSWPDHRLFNAGNSLADLVKYRNMMAEGAEPGNNNWDHEEDDEEVTEP